MHCAVEHWGALSHANEVAITNRLRHYESIGETAFHRLILEMMEGVRPKEDAALVIAGALFPTDLQIRGWFRSRIFEDKSQIRNIPALIYGLCPHLDHDEDLADFFMVKIFKWSKYPNELSTLIFCLKDALSIWRSAAGSGRCASCGIARGSRLIQRPPDSQS